MSYELVARLVVLAGLVSILVPVIHALVLPRIERVNLKRLVGLIVFLLSLVVWDQLSPLLHKPIANMFPNLQGVECTMLKEYGCERRADCYLFEQDPLGEHSEGVCINRTSELD